MAHWQCRLNDYPECISIKFMWFICRAYAEKHNYSTVSLWRESLQFGNLSVSHFFVTECCTVNKIGCCGVCSLCSYMWGWLHIFFMTMHKSFACIFIYYAAVIYVSGRKVVCLIMYLKFTRAVPNSGFNYSVRKWIVATTIRLNLSSCNHTSQTWVTCLRIRFVSMWWLGITQVLHHVRIYRPPHALQLNLSLSFHSGPCGWCSSLMILLSC